MPQGPAGERHSGFLIREEKNRDGEAACTTPGLFEFYELYKKFLPLFREHRDWFHEGCTIGSIYGAPAGCPWDGGRAGFGEAKPAEVAAMMREYGISARLTFSNSLLREKDLSDPECNRLCALFERNGNVPGGVILSSDLLLRYLQERYPGLSAAGGGTLPAGIPLGGAGFPAEQRSGPAGRIAAGDEGQGGIPVQRGMPVRLPGPEGLL